MATNEPGSSRTVVTLDLWLTLIAELDGGQQSMKRREVRADFTSEVLGDFGLFAPREELLEASSQISEMVTSDHDLGVDLDYNDRIIQMLTLVDEDLVERLGDSGVQDIADAVDRAFLENPPLFLPGAKEVLEQLKSLDTAVALISNTGLTSASAYRSWFAAEGVLDQFDELVFSNEAACAKPNPDIFLPTLAKLECEAASGLHIGDNLLTDISGAAGVGMRTGWISGHDAREPIVEPDYTLASITDLPGVIEQWLASTAVSR